MDDWISPLSGLIGALVGASASFFGSQQVLKRQLQADREAREETERTAVVASLSEALTALLDHAALIPEPHQDKNPAKVPRHARPRYANEQTWNEQWQPLVRSARVAALEVRNTPLRERLTAGLKYLADWRMLEYALHGKIRSWVLTKVVDHLVACVYAWRRGEPSLPAESPEFNDVAKAWRLKQDEYEELDRTEEEDTTEGSPT
ncbi:hypothetical protein [Actinomadura bangladeshensis]|uniref:DUF4760 domain-containing protein n=1 Tax=Actinomadura bangladeshensis TaxID=453573 RepID=A0A6L9QBB5_9ACTN|nr:hypothetical protein [Actinomadura bangladeshensis]NEA21953.1 hypothetical protein [Actinomadura bangladeshensis]